MSEFRSAPHFARRLVLSFGLIGAALAIVVIGHSGWQKEATIQRDSDEMHFSAAAPMTPLSKLPALQDPAGRWDFIVGLNAVTVGKAKDGEPIVRIAAEPGKQRHGVGVRFDGLRPDSNYHVQVWVKDVVGPNIRLEVRDSVDPRTGHAPDYTFADFDLTTGAEAEASGSLIGAGSKEAGGGWRNLWVNFHSKDGAVFAAVYLLEAGRNLLLFKTVGQYLTLRGFNVSLLDKTSRMQVSGSMPKN